MEDTRKNGVEVEVTIPGNETDEVECVEEEDNKQKIVESAKKKERRVSDNILGIQRQDKDFTLKITKSLSPIPLRKKSQPNTLGRSTGSSSCASPSTKAKTKIESTQINGQEATRREIDEIY